MPPCRRQNSGRACSRWSPRRSTRRSSRRSRRRRYPGRPACPRSSRRSRRRRCPGRPACPRRSPRVAACCFTAPASGGIRSSHSAGFRVPTYTRRSTSANRTPLPDLSRRYLSPLTSRRSRAGWPPMNVPCSLPKSSTCTRPSPPDVEARVRPGHQTRVGDHDITALVPTDRGRPGPQRDRRRPDGTTLVTVRPFHRHQHNHIVPRLLRLPSEQRGRSMRVRALHPALFTTH